jgi:hypothetical protein
MGLENTLGLSVHRIHRMSIQTCKEVDCLVWKQNHIETSKSDTILEYFEMGEFLAIL